MPDPPATPAPGPVVLGSLRFDRLAALLPDDGGRLVFVPTAANDLPDRDDVVAQYREPLRASGWCIDDLDLDDATDVETARRLRGAAGVFVSGGDPYRLLAAARSGSFAAHVARLLARGGGYIGASAGALAAGPTLAVLGGVTPFARPDGIDLRGLGLTDRVVLPHDDRPGRRQRHAAAQRRHGAEHRVLAITDDELFLAGRPWRLLDQRQRWWLRPAATDDADAISTVFVDAGRTAWDFLGTQRHTDMAATPDRWRARVAGAADPDDFVVVADDDGVAGFASVRAADDAEFPDGHGEVAHLFTHPRLWGRGAGRRLLTSALDRLRAGGHHTAVLWTEQRNARALAVYRRAGWRPDGRRRTRTFLDQPITELRHRIAL